MSKLSESPPPHRERASKRYLALDTGVLFKVTYVSIGRESEFVRWMILNEEPTRIEDIPVLIECLPGKSLVPVRMFRDPFTLDPNKLVLCEVQLIDEPPGNERMTCVKRIEMMSEDQFQFGVNQECCLNGATDESAVMSAKAEDIGICHFRACQYAGVKICCSHGDRSPSKWVFQVGPCEGIEMGDHLWMARYILDRMCIDFGVTTSCDYTVSFSTKQMREEGGLTYIEAAAKKLSANIPYHVKKSGRGYLECKYLRSINPYTRMRQILQTFDCDGSD